MPLRSNGKRLFRRKAPVRRAVVSMCAVRASLSGVIFRVKFLSRRGQGSLLKRERGPHAGAVSSYNNLIVRRIRVWP